MGGCTEVPTRNSSRNYTNSGAPFAIASHDWAEAATVQTERLNNPNGEIGDICSGQQWNVCVAPSASGQSCPNGYYRYRVCTPTATTVGKPTTTTTESSCGVQGFPSKATFTGDPCKALTADSHSYAGTSIFSVPDALSCFNQFPVTSTQRRDHTDAIKRFINFHPYLDLMKHSKPPQFPSNINPLKELDEIAENNFLASEHEFHNAIYTLINGLNDAHSNYDPLCFVNKVKVYQPFLMAGVLDAEPPGVTVVGTVFDDGTGFDLYWNVSLKGVPASGYVGYAVKEINGVDALVSTLFILVLYKG
ncbi:UNVERIFIED_CONTAM: hypothetical protein HDU68_006289 [Siphonaria sp. JEL0065]|nr:hypothetical protein HDU68_006289 [Siphonaria sp. JEL0065]